jgi:endonuclease G
MDFSTFSQQEAIITHSDKKIILHKNGTWIYIDNISTGKTKIEELEIPKSSQNQNIIHHTGFSLAYNEKHEQANLVAFELIKAETIKLVERNNQFKPDPKVAIGSATYDDYKASGFDRGDT